jgi:hypothetical protein
MYHRLLAESHGYSTLYQIGTIDLCSSRQAIPSCVGADACKTLASAVPWIQYSVFSLGLAKTRAMDQPRCARCFADLLPKRVSPYLAHTSHHEVVAYLSIQHHLRKVYVIGTGKSGHYLLSIGTSDYHVQNIGASGCRHVNPSTIKGIIDDPMILWGYLPRTSPISFKKKTSFRTSHIFRTPAD